MSFGFHPVPKESQIRKVPVKHRKQHSKPEVHKGRLIPKRSVRGRITRAEYNKTIDMHGYECFFCGKTMDLECHHVVPKGHSKSRSGRGVWRNLRFLCEKHHRGDTGVHGNQKMMQQLQEYHESLYGPHFYKDVYDLFKENWIHNTEFEEYESFMQEEERKARYRNIDVDCSENAYF